MTLFDHPFSKTRPALAALKHIKHPAPDHVVACLLELVRVHTNGPPVRPAQPAPAEPFEHQDKDGDKLTAEPSASVPGTVALTAYSVHDSVCVFLDKDGAARLIAWLSAFYALPEAAPCPTPPTT